MKIIDSKNRVLTPEDIKEREELDKLLAREKMTDELEKFLADLEAAAEKATPGPWYVDGDEVRYDFDSYATDNDIADCSVSVCKVPWLSEKLDQNGTTREFIAKANPDTVKRLIREIRLRDEVIRAQAEALDAIASGGCYLKSKNPKTVAREAQEKVASLLKKTGEGGTP